MDWTYRTVLRVFLVVGGGALLVLGILNSDVLNVGVGAIAVLLGGVGLAHEWRQASEGQGEDQPSE